MNDDIRGTLSRAIPDDLPAPRIDIDDLERRGEAKAKRRTYGVVGATTLGVAVVAAAALMLPTAFAGAGTTQAADDGGAKPVEQKAYPLPELDPDEFYEWIGNENKSKPEDSTETKETKELTDGFWDYFEQEFPDFKVIDTDPEGPFQGEPEKDELPDEPRHLDPENYPAVMRGENTLGIVKDMAKDEWPDVSGSAMLDATDYTKPVYGMPPEAGVFGGTSVQMAKGAEDFDAFDISFHPKGSFAPGPKSIDDKPGRGAAVPHLAEGCEDYTDDSKGGGFEFKYEYDCQSVDGPGGSKLEYISLSVFGGQNIGLDKVDHRVNTVIATLDNGNAVVINDMAGKSIDGGDPPEGSKLKPAMSCEDLGDLALSLPEVVIK